MALRYWRATYANGVTLALSAADQRAAYQHASQFVREHAVLRIDALDAKPEDLGRFVYAPS